jgi:hypothetical protein
VHWDGNEWSLQRITVRLQYNGTVIYTDADDITAIFAANNNDIWFVSDAGGVTRLKDNNWLFMEIPYGIGPGSTNKIWGLSSPELYFVGPNGKITYYIGQTWQRIVSRTDLPINDIWGAQNPKTNEYEVLCVANYILHDTTKKVLKISGNSVKEIPIRGFRSFIDGIWFVPQRKYYIVGSGIFYNNDINKPDNWQTYPPGSLTNYHTHKIKGNSINDVVAVGSFGEIVHFNGYTWKNYYNVTQLNSGAYYSVDIKDDLIITTGYLNSRAVIAIGNR